jgi:hypothetical protein
MTPITWPSGSVKRPIVRPSITSSGLDVGYLDVERHVAVVALGTARDAPADPDAVGVGVAVAGDDPVLELVVGVDVPVEQLGEVALKLLRVLPCDLEVHYCLAH